MNRLEFYNFTLLAYPFIPEQEAYDSYWLNMPNSYCDGRIAHQRMEDMLEVYAASERFGYDGIVVNEHHATPGAITPSPNLTAALLIPRTQRIPIAVVGNMLPAHLTPVRVAEELAMLDVASGGRIKAGFVRGTGMEYYAHPVDPSRARERFWEAHDLILKAWREPGPFAWNGDHFHVPVVNPWPRPVQQPHPEIWIPGVGSLDTIERVAEEGHRYMTIFAPQFFVKAQYQMFRAAAEKIGREVKPNQLLASVPTYVAETDEQAHREARAHMMWVYQRHLRVPPHIFFPPGFMEKRSLRNMLEAKMKYGIKDFDQLEYEDLLEQGYIIVGSPDTVVNRLGEFCDDVGAGGIIGVGSPFGAMPKWMALKNMQIMAEEVFPHFRAADGKPVWARSDRPAAETVAEHAATVGQPEYPPTVRVRLDEPPVDARTAHLRDAG